MKKYDAIIIGSGLGGLSASATLARRGLKILLLEQHTQPGGYATTFHRDQFEFEVSLHALSGIGTPEKPGPLFTQLDEMGVAKRVGFIRMNELYRSKGPTWDFMVPAGVEAYKAALTAQFPEEAKGIENIVNQVLTIGYEVDQLREGGHSKAPLPVLLRFPNLVHGAGVPLSSLLDRELTSPLAKLAVAQIWSYFALPPSRLSLLMFAAGLNSHLLYGSAGLVGKSQSLSNGFVDAIREAGGDVAFSKVVRRILVQAGRVTGVETETGERIEATTIIANVNPVTTLTKLVDQDEVPTSLLKRLRTMPPSLGAVNLYLGLSRPSSSVGISDYEVFLNTNTNLDSHYRACLTLAPPENLTLCAYDNINKAACPEGRGIINITALSDGHFWSDMKPGKYTESKSIMTDWILKEVTKAYPKLEGAIQTLSVSTPLTNMRYTGNPGGAIYGFANTPALNPGFRLSPEGPVSGLYFAGAWTQPGGGYQATIASGLNAAESAIGFMEQNGAVIRKAEPSGRIPQEKPPGAFFRKLRGMALVLKDGKKVKTTLATKYRKVKGAAAPRCTVADIVKRFYADDLTVTLKERLQETDDTVTLRFVSNSEHPLPPFMPGQYFSIKVTRGQHSTRRAYSASSSPFETDHLDVTIKGHHGGDVSAFLTKQLKVGDEVDITGPFGDFSYNPFRDQPNILAIAVGSGITPFMSMLSAFELSRQPPKVTLFFGSRSETDMIFNDRLEALEKRVDWLTVIRVLSKPDRNWQGETGRIHFDLVNRLVPNLAEKTIFLCAPRDLYTVLVPKFVDAGVNRGRIRLEAFGPPSDITTEAGWPKDLHGNASFIIHLQGVDRPFHAMAGVPLLDSLEKAGIHPKAHCRAGVCDACKVELVSGQVFTPADHLGIQVGGDGKRIQTCMSYPVSDLDLID